MRIGLDIPFLVLIVVGRAFAQSAPASPARPWHSPAEQEIEGDAKHLSESRFTVEPDKVYSLAELVDLAETHNPETRVAWEGARAQAASLGVA
jgi:outer membrane protein